jgi:hypothetical protein
MADAVVIGAGPNGLANRLGDVRCADGRDVEARRAGRRLELGYGSVG